MDWGLKNRLARIIKPHNNRALMLAVDHGYFLGPTERLENARKTITPLLKYCDSLMLTRGIQRTSVDPNTSIPMVLRVSGGASIIGEDLSQEQITVTMKEAIRLNVSAVAMSMFVGSKYENQTIVNLGKLVSEAEEYGIPVLAVTAVGKELGKDARYLSLACRIAAEQGAHIVKTYYCDNFKKVVESCPVPIIVAGGKKIPEREAMQLTFNAIKAGAVGVDMGRNIWQSDHPVEMIRAIRSIVHGNADVDQAYKLYQQLITENQKNPGQKNNPNQKPKNNPNQKPKNNPNQKPKNNPNQKPNNSPQNNRNKI
jgi:putative autoinducer-2 (AI-2) aldolase